MFDKGFRVLPSKSKISQISKQVEKFLINKWDESFPVVGLILYQS